MLGFGDPGDCLICGTAHCACGGPSVVTQLPQRDAGAELAPVAPGPSAAPSLAEQLQATLPPGAVTTGTYRRPKRV